MVASNPAKASRRISIYFRTSEQRKQFLSEAKAEGETSSSFVRRLYREWRRSQVNSSAPGEVAISGDSAAPQIVKGPEVEFPK
jgi:ribosome recycling factor